MSQERFSIVRSAKGFTLIEMLIVVAIIAILASIIIVGLGPAQQSGRDARRLSDLQSIQNALQLYYQKCGFYPGVASCGSAFTPPSNWAGLVTALQSVGVTNIPNDPTAGRGYVYSVSADGSAYVLGAQLENANNSVFVNYNPPALFPTTVASGTAPTSCAQPSYCVTLQ